MMFRRGRIKPSKPISFMAMIVGIILVVLGITVVIPRAGTFGIIWTFVAVAITLFYAYNVFSRRGAAFFEVDVDSGKEVKDSREDFDVRIRKLAKLRDDGLISNEEYERKRAEIMREKW